ncbi:hypothetical protein PIB30_087944 [Stylosanthes scabra]|uniref:Uncharacterized protein n=1 Tax=Stylosanthes scabra TaxID=79078 RepID=A0ABU6RTT0_9FABA|nr:hypothetical protein [Stylosanthes scabra]
MSYSDQNDFSFDLMDNDINMLIVDELRYDRRKLAEDHNAYTEQLTDEQQEVYLQDLMHLTGLALESAIQQLGLNELFRNLAVTRS